MNLGQNQKLVAQSGHRASLSKSLLGPCFSPPSRPSSSCQGVPEKTAFQPREGLMGDKGREVSVFPPPSGPVGETRRKSVCQSEGLLARAVTALFKMLLENLEGPK